MPAFLLILFAIAMRFLNAYTHGAFLFNFSPVGAALLFFGSRQEPKRMWAPVALMVCSDIILTVFFYHYPVSTFQFGSLLYYAIAVGLGMLLKNNRSIIRVAGVTLAGSLTFFFISNFFVWLSGGMYSPTLQGLADCYAAALPFFRGTITGDAIFATLFFGVPALVASYKSHNNIAAA